jgi:hypothetical protein
MSGIQIFRPARRTITYNELRNVIIDEKLTQYDTIILHSYDFDSIVLEYREFYHEPLESPHLLLEVLVRESEGEDIPRNRIGILKNDHVSFRTTEHNQQSFDGEVFYRCGYCGNAVDSNGRDLEGDERSRTIFIIENEKGVIVSQVYGDCCRSKNQALY